MVGNENFAPLAAGATTPTCNLVTGVGGTQIPDPQCFAGDVKASKVVPTYEYVFGGPIMRDRLTFFTAGRFQNQESARNTVNPTNVPYLFEEKRQRYEIKPQRRASIPTIGLARRTRKKPSTRSMTGSATSWTCSSLRNRETPLDSYQVNYSGILSSTFFVEARFSRRQFSFIGSGARSRDPIEGRSCSTSLVGISGMVVHVLWGLRSGRPG